MLVEIFIRELVVLEMLLQAASCSQRAPKLPQHSLSHSEELREPVDEEVVNQREKDNQQAEARSRFRPCAGSVSGTRRDGGSRQTCPAAASRLELQMCQVRERKGFKS